MASPRILFFGTPEFAVPTAAALHREGWTPILVVSQPDRPVGRGRRLSAPPVARWASEQGIDLVQPESVRDRDFLDRLRLLRPDLAVVVAYGQIFRRSLLELPRWGCLNLHASLLPAYRGAAPIQAALADGLGTTGVTTMRMERGLDSGPIYLSREIAIEPGEMASELSNRLAIAGAELVLETIRGLERGDLAASPQTEEGVSYAQRVVKADGVVDWSQNASRLVDLERAYTPWPGLSTTWRGETVKLFDFRSVPSPDAKAAPGSLLGLSDERLSVACGGGTAVGVGRLQRAGRKALPAGEFLRGWPTEGDRRFGEAAE